MENMVMMPMDGFLNMGSMNMGMGNMNMGNMGMSNMGMGNKGRGKGGGGGSVIPEGGFKKTKLCTKHQAGFCENGDQCTFAHGEHELGTPQPEGKINRAALGAGGKGFTPKPGDWCCSQCGDHQFAKNESCRKCGGPRPFGCGGPVQGSFSPMPMQGSFSPVPASSDATGWSADEANELANNGFGGGGSNSSGFVPNPGGFKKTKLCTKHEAGFCEKGDQCTFAHGPEQIGDPQPSGSFNAKHAFGSPSPSGMGTKPGDWNCSQCGDHQFAKNEQCRKCGAPKPDVASADGSALFKKKPGDWFCPSCNDLNFAKNVVCRKCNTPNPDPEKSESEAVAHGMEQEMKPGDWFCPSCNDLQFARNTSCRKCGTPNPHPEACLEAAAASGSWKTSAKPQRLPGDWKCSNCGNHVFAKHNACPRCGSANPNPKGKGKGKGKDGDKGKGKGGDKGKMSPDMASMLSGGNFVVVPTEMFQMMMQGKGMSGMSCGGGGDSWGGNSGGKGMSSCGDSWGGDSGGNGMNGSGDNWSGDSGGKGMNSCGDSWGGKDGGKGSKGDRYSPW